MEDFKLAGAGQRTLVLKGFEQQHLAGFIASLFERLDLDLLYYITEFDTRLPVAYRDRIVIIPINLLDKLPYVDWNAFDPIDAELVDRMHDVESIVMAMFERSYAFHHSYILRRRSYLQLLRFWYTLGRRGDFQGMVCDILPHAPTDHTLYGLCHALGWPKMYFDNLLPGFITVWEHWDRYPAGLERVPENAPERDLTHRAELVWKAQTKEKGGEAPYYMDADFWARYQKNAKRRLRYRVLNKPRTPQEKRNLISLPYLYLQAERYFQSKVRLPLKGWLLERQLRRHARLVDPTAIGRFIYVAIHMQPEVSSGPRAGAYVDQQLIVEQLAACVPDDLLLVVKENPKQTGLFRDRNIYRDLSRLRNVVLVPKEQDTFDLIANCTAIATSTGTAGWEGIFRGKPVICFGYPFYRAARGVRVVMRTEEVREAVRDLVEGRFALPGPQSSLDFLHLLDDVAIEGNLDANKEHLLASPAGLVEKLTASVVDHLR